MIEFRRVLGVPESARFMLVEDEENELISPHSALVAEVTQCDCLSRPAVILLVFCSFRSIRAITLCARFVQLEKLRWPRVGAALTQRVWTQISRRQARISLFPLKATHHTIPAHAHHSCASKTMRSSSGASVRLFCSPCWQVKGDIARCCLKVFRCPSRECRFPTVSLSFLKIYRCEKGRRVRARMSKCLGLLLET
jgi:hypothetical protein